MVYLGVFPTAIAFSTYAFALSSMTAGNLSVTTYLVPPITVLMSWVLLSEAPPAHGVRRRRALPARRRAGPTAAESRARSASRLSPEAGRAGGQSRSSQPRNASRFLVDSPRLLRHSHSLRIEVAKPSSRMVLKDSSA